MSTTTNSQDSRTRILSKKRSPLGGLDIQARFQCGHTQRVIFPHASARTSDRMLSEWCGEQCSVCEREGEQ